MQQKNVRHVSLVDQNVAVSSSVKSTPAMGAPKAAATPAAAPQATKSRFSWSLRKSWILVADVSTPQVVVRPCARPAAKPPPTF
jgi:hypothetical protein